MAVQNEHVAVFNDAFKKIINRLSSDFPNDDKVDRLKKRILVGLELNPLTALEKVGPQLEKYQTQIYEMVDNCDESFFMSQNYEEDLKDPSTKELGIDLIRKTKECISRLKGDEKKYYIELVEIMLNSYIDFIH